MNEVLGRLLTPTALPGFAFVLTRTTGMMMVAPLWSMNGIPKRVRSAITIAITLAVLPAAPLTTLPDSMVLLPLDLAMEFFIGMLLGLTAAVLVHGVAVGGEILSHQMGLGLAAAVTGLSDISVPGVGQLKTYLALLVYVILDGHLMLVRGIADSLTVLPPGTAFSLDPAVGMVIELGSTVFSVAVRAAAPAIAALVLVDVAIAIASKAIPQVQAILVLFPVSIGVGLLVVGIALPSIAAPLVEWVSELPVRVAEVLSALEPPETP